MVRQGIRTLILLLVLALGWEWLHLAAGNAGLSSPGQTVGRLVALLGTDSFWNDIAATGSAFALAVVLSLGGGLLLGALLGTGRLAAAVSEPLLVNLYSLPKVTLYPVVLLVFGLGMSAKVAFGVMHGLIPLTLFTMNAMAQIRPAFMRTAKIMRLSWLQTVTMVALPAILPDVLTGARLSVSLSLLGVLIGEMFASSRGLGHLVTVAMDSGDTATVLAIALLLAVFAVTVNAVLLAAGRRGAHARILGE
jgi:NitT/TauT family transport system permease protein